MVIWIANGGLTFHKKILLKTDNNLIEENLRMKVPSYASSNASMRQVDWADTNQQWQWQYVEHSKIVILQGSYVII